MTIQTIFAGSKAPIDTANSIFLAGPGAGDVHMLGGWRRMLVKRLEKHEAHTGKHVQLIIPEPESGLWDDLINDKYTEKEQTLWEHQHLMNSRVVAFWLPTYWNAESAGSYPANIGPSSRFELGFHLSQLLKDKNRKLIIGSPKNAQALNWAKVITEKYSIKWHYPDPEKNWQFIPESFIDEMISGLF